MERIFHDKFLHKTGDVGKLSPSGDSVTSNHGYSIITVLTIITIVCLQVVHRSNEAH